MTYYWENISELPPQKYVCGFCTEDILSNKGYKRIVPIQDGRVSRAVYEYIYFCHHCDRPTFINKDGSQFPGGLFGGDVEDLPEDVEKLYLEARACLGEHMPTASILCSRKLLMHIAVDEGAEDNKTFIYYVEFLTEKGFAPPGSEDWVDIIRTKGNEANHEIKIMTEEEAKDLLIFLEMLLKLIYEFPSKVKKNKPET